MIHSLMISLRVGGGSVDGTLRAGAMEIEIDSAGGGLIRVHTTHDPSCYQTESGGYSYGVASLTHRVASEPCG